MLQCAKETCQSDKGSVGFASSETLVTQAGWRGSPCKQDGGWGSCTLTLTVVRIRRRRRRAPLRRTRRYSVASHGKVERLLPLGRRRRPRHPGRLTRRRRHLADHVVLATRVVLQGQSYPARCTGSSDGGGRCIVPASESRAHCRRRRSNRDAALRRPAPRRPLPPGPPPGPLRRPPPPADAASGSGALRRRSGGRGGGAKAQAPALGAPSATGAARRGGISKTDGVALCPHVASRRRFGVPASRPHPHSRPSGRAAPDENADSCLRRPPVRRQLVHTSQLGLSAAYLDMPSE